MTTSEDILKGPFPDVRVGVGICGDKTCAEKYEKTFPGKIVIYDDPKQFADDFCEGKIDAAIRGNMSSSVLLPLIRDGLGLKELERTVILETANGKMICVAPVGIDEGWTVEQKLNLVRRSVPLLKKLGMGGKVAIMSGGRMDDMGRNSHIDDTIIDAKEIVDILKKEGIDAYDAEILIEDAVKEADLIIAPDGISGNLIFRTLHFIGGAKALGAPVINTNKIFVDTSRAKTDYTDSIALAMKLTEKEI